MVHSSGLLIYRHTGSQDQADGPGEVELLLTHPGGPFWANKDDWSIPKGELDEDETLLQALEREFIEEVGIDPPLHALIDLGESIQSSAKTNHIWAAEADLDISQFHCDSMVVMPWPPRSSTVIEFPENDKAAWFEISQAYAKIFRSQMVFVERLAAHLGIELAAIAEPTNSTLF